MKANEIMPATYFSVFFVLSMFLSIAFPIIEFIYPPYTYLGWLLIAFGVILNIWADSLFRKHKTTVKPHLKPSKLVTNGPFKLCRHPMYLGMFSILLGVAVVFGALIAFIFSILFIAIMEIVFIPVEENNLRKAFGERYLEYKKKTRRWI